MARVSIASIDRASLAVAAMAMAAGIALAVRPITLLEAYAFTHFVRLPVRDLLGAFDPAASPLNILLMKRAVGLLGLSAFSLRLPDLAGLALILWAAANLSRRRWPVVALAGAAGLLVEFLLPGTALMLALGLWLCGLDRALSYLAHHQPDNLRNLNQAGLCFGLAIAASFCLLIPSILAAIALPIVRRRCGIPLLPEFERLPATAIVTAFLFLILPFSDATPHQLLNLLLPHRMTAGFPSPDVDGVVAALEREARGKPVRIAVPSAFVPLLEFYRARDRAGDWRIFKSPHEADYTVDQVGTPLPGPLLFQGGRLVLARTSHAGT